jgi:alpha-amylase/alpha-mannosidase (GH57 family)
MAEKKIKTAFLWHQHQPYYKNLKGYFQMPWVRLHGIKDYLDMILVLKEFPEIKQMVNLVPSLLYQLKDYVDYGVKDNIWLLTNKPTGDLSIREKQAVLENFFMAHYEHMIKPYPRYNELYKKYYQEVNHLALFEQVRQFSDQELTDLQVWFNLTWVGILSRERPKIKALFEKGRNFNEVDKEVLLQEHLNIIRDIFSTYKEMWESGQIELSTTPYYHPILPLLVDSSIGKVSDSHIQLPEREFRHPEDAEKQLNKGLEYFERIFGRKPAGIWPSEGSVSEAVAEIISKFQIRWIATDEEILSKSMGEKYKSTSLYQPYQYKNGNKFLNIFFRDHELSDAIGFVYGGWDEDKAVNDFITRLLAIRSRIVSSAAESDLPKYIISIILDGENCWEFYKNDGKDFLRKLYGSIVAEPLIETVNYSEFLDKNSDIPQLQKIHPGSWINSNFNIWIGSSEDNRAWDLLKETRDYLFEKQKEGSYPQELVDEAWEQVYIAEGSDWCWWYGDEHSSAQDLEFDLLFRQHLIKVYEIFGDEVPIDLYQNIKKRHYSRFKSIAPLYLIAPIIDGKSSHYFEWNGAAIYDGSKLPQSAMHQVSRLIDKVFVGFNLENLYLRIDFLSSPNPMYEYVISIKIPNPMTLVLSPLKGVIEKFQSENGKFRKTTLNPALKLDTILEAAVSFADLEIVSREKLGFQIQIKEKNQTIERFPSMNIIEIEVPDENYNLRDWSA